MYASPGVVVNGAKSLAHEALPGDVIEIPANDTAVLHPSGDAVFLAQQSSAVYLKRAVQLRYGTTKVSTTTHLALSVYQYTVTPTPAVPQETKYEVMWSNAGGRVRVYEGEVRVDGCRKRLNVPQDKIAELGRDCKVGAYLRPQGFRPVYALGLAAPATPIICYYLCLSNLSCPDKNGKFNSPHP
ncbi:MAG: hypothetical protein ACXVZV_15185 [Terriglobales bacterium]